MVSIWVLAVSFTAIGGSFTLITDMEQVESGPAFKSGEVLALRKPVDDSELDNLLKTVESNEPARK